MSRLGVLAEGEELSPNPLQAFFNDLQTTHICGVCCLENPHSYLTVSTCFLPTAFHSWISS
jgi:hypothetical protein